MKFKSIIVNSSPIISLANIASAGELFANLQEEGFRISQKILKEALMLSGE